jgi:polar amino acid transport system substrate-binding protein
MKRLVVALIALIASGKLAHADHFSLATLEFPPYEFQEDGKARGIAVDVVTEAMRRLGHTVEVRVYPWARALDAARSGDVDGLFTAYKTPDREAFLDYSGETLVPQIVSLFVVEGSPIRFDGSLSKLAGSSFGIVNQLSYGKVFDQAMQDGTLKKLEKTNDTALSAKMLVAGRFDILVSNKYVALYNFKKLGIQGKIRELTPVVEDVPSYIAFTKTRDLNNVRRDFDGALKAMRADGAYDRIVKIYSE